MAFPLCTIACEVCGRLKVAAAMLAGGQLEVAGQARYAGWDKNDAKELMSFDISAIKATGE